MNGARRARLPAIDAPAIAPPYPAGEPRFAPGDPVRVKCGAAPGHLRTPWYLRGKTGVVERICGAFANPEKLAYALDPGAPVPLYRVRFAQAELWDAPERAEDTLDAEIYEHWLEPADAP